MTDAVELSQTVGRIIDSYVAIHDDILAPSTWQAIRRVVPVPGIFEAIPYDAHAQALLMLREDLRNVGAEAAALLASAGPQLPHSRFLAELRPYCLALDDSIARLSAICRQMADKANGAQGPSYAQYQHELAEYHKSIATYTALGERLNETWRAAALDSPPMSDLSGERARSAKQGNESQTFLTLVGEALTAYHRVHSHGDILHLRGWTGVKDVTASAKYRVLVELDPQPPGFELRMYEFLPFPDQTAVIDVVFKGPELVNIRAQLFFSRIGSTAARRFYSDDLLPQMNSLFGHPTRADDDSAIYTRDRVVGVARFVPGTESVSVYLIDERYV